MTSHALDSTKYGEVVMLDPETNEKWHLPILKQGQSISGVRFSGLGTYPPKQAIADWTRSHHEVLSSFTQSDTTGGGQIKESNESIDLSRFWWATLDTQHPRQVTLLPQYKVIAGPGGICIPLGDYGTSQKLVAFGTALHRVTDTGTVSVGTLAHVPLVTEGTSYDGGFGSVRFWIPMGTNGFQVWDGATLSLVFTDIKPLHFMEYNGNLYALTVDGKVMESITGTSAWVEKARVDRSTEPRKMVKFYDRSDNFTLHILTKRGVYAVSINDAKAYETRISPPPHPNAARTGAVWRTDLYISYGISASLYTGNSIVPVGLDRGFGLPAEVKGYITDFVDTQNFLLALVRGRPTPTVDQLNVQSDLGRYDVHVPGATSSSYIMLWNAFGWHTLWTSEEVTDTPSHMVMTVANDTYTLHWGIGNNLYTMELSPDFHTPEMRDSSIRFHTHGMIEYAELDMSMVGLPKLYIALEIRAKDLSPTETITVEYKIDNGPFRVLAVLNHNNVKYKMHRYQLGYQGTMPDNVTPRYDGETGDTITVRCSMVRGSDATKSPMLESMGIVFHKLMGVLNSYQFIVDCTDVDEYAGKTARERQLWLQKWVRGHKLIPFLHQGIWRSVRFAGVSGEDNTGVDLKGDRSVALLEVLEEELEQQP